MTRHALSASESNVLNLKVYNADTTVTQVILMWFSDRVSKL